MVTAKFGRRRPARIEGFHLWFVEFEGKGNALGSQIQGKL